MIRKHKKRVLQPVKQNEEMPPKPKDYLREMKKQKKAGKDTGSGHVGSELDKLLSNQDLTNIDKYTLVKIKTA